MAVLITNVSPSQGPRTGGTNVTMLGSGFKRGVKVFFGATKSSSVSYRSKTQITALSPSGTGVVTIRVENPGKSGDSASKVNAFTYIAPPSILSISPRNGPIEGGTVLTITGQNFDPEVEVSLNGVNAIVLTNPDDWTGTSFQVLTPVNPAGQYAVVVTNLDGQFSTYSSFTYTATIRLDQVVPRSGTTAGGTPVSLLGDGFVDGTTVTFDGISATSITIVSPTEIDCLTPAHAAGVVEVRVTAPNGEYSRIIQGFDYLLTDVIISAGFETGDLSEFDTIWGPQDMVVQPDVKQSGQLAVRMRYHICGDQLNPACGSSHQDINRSVAWFFNSARGFPNGLEHFFVRGYVRFATPQAGFNPNSLQRKIYWFANSGSSPGWQSILTSDSAGGVINLRITRNGSTTCGVVPASFFPAGPLGYDTWYSIECEIGLNTPGVVDGIFNVWVDGISVYTNSVFNHRGTCNTGCGYLAMGRQTDRNNYQSVEEFRYWDNIVVATSYIGP